MRKMTVEMVPEPSLVKPSEEQISKVEWVRVLEMIRLDFEKGVSIVLAEAKFEHGWSIEDIEFPEGSEILATLRQEGDLYTYIAKLKHPEEYRWLLDKMNLDLIWDTPLYKSKDLIVLSVIGRDSELRQFLENLKSMGQIKSAKFSKPTFNSFDPLSCLTSRQREIMIAAYENGYYDYPRRMDAGELARKLGLNKATVIEHLRKAEGRMMTHTMAGF